MKRKAFSSLLVIVLCFLMTACGGSGTRTVHINRTSVLTSAVTQIMEARGILEKHLPEGVIVEWSGLATGPDIRDAIVSENVDIGDIAFSNFISSYENGLPLTLLSFCGATDIRIYSNNPEINELSDISPNSRIAITNKGTNLHTAFLAHCKDVLGDPMIYDGNLVSIPASDALASIQTSDEFDVAIFSFPNYLKAEQIDGLKLLADMEEMIEKYNIGSVYVVNSEFYSNNPDIVEAFLAAQQETIRFMSENPDETAEILSELYGVDGAEIKTVLEQLPPRMEIDGYDEQAGLLYEAGILTEQPVPFEELSNYDSLPQ